MLRTKMWPSYLRQMSTPQKEQKNFVVFSILEEPSKVLYTPEQSGLGQGFRLQPSLESLWSKALFTMVLVSLWSSSKTVKSSATSNSLQSCGSIKWQIQFCVSRQFITSSEHRTGHWADLICISKQPLQYKWPQFWRRTSSFESGGEKQTGQASISSSKFGSRLFTNSRIEDLNCKVKWIVLYYLLTLA